MLQLKRVGFGFMLVILGLGYSASALCAPQDTSRNSVPCMSASAFIKDRMQGMFRSQLAGGALSFAGEDGWFETHPLLATMSLEAYRLDRDEIFLRQAYASIVSHFNHLFIEKDRDGDFLVESVHPSGQDVLQESAAFNAMLALDMENLARICLELGLPLRGLFWFDSTRLIKERLVTTCYDPDINAFSSVHPTTHMKYGSDEVYSLLASLFANSIGENISTAMLMNYLADPGAFHSQATDGASAGKVDSPQVTKRRIDKYLEILLLAEALDQNGLETQADSFRKNNAPTGQLPEDNADRPKGTGVYDDFLVCRLTQYPGKPVFAVLIELELFAKIAGAHALLNAKEIASLSQHLDQIRQFLDACRRGTAGNGTETSSNAAATLTAVRGVYKSISIAKERFHSGVIFSARDRSDIPGFDLGRAYQDLLMDAILSLRRVETALFDQQGAAQGFRLTSRLQMERIVAGQMITIQVSASANRAPEQIRSIILSRGSVIDTLYSHDPCLLLGPQDAPLIANHPFWVPSDWSPGVHTIAFTVDVHLGSGEHRKTHFRKSVYVDAPLTFHISFPEGNTLQQWGVPLDIHLQKHAPYAMSVQTGWFSPSGLSLKEGKSQSLYMEENQTEVSARIHVLAPNPVRPG
ncbi:MAG: hypothetical protein ABIA59_06165, partial [Candidatus Latescibacterota bacterium]